MPHIWIFGAPRVAVDKALQQMASVDLPQPPAGLLG